MKWFKYIKTKDMVMNMCFWALAITNYLTAYFARISFNFKMKLYEDENVLEIISQTYRSMIKSSGASLDYAVWRVSTVFFVFCMLMALVFTAHIYFVAKEEADLKGMYKRA